MSIYAISGLPEITDEEQKFLCDNPNTADIVDWVREYAAKATHALRQQLEEAQSRNDFIDEAAARVPMDTLLIARAELAEAECAARDEIIERLEQRLADAEGQEGDWEIDLSAGRPILVYKKCSVIEDAQARFVLRLIKATPPATDERVKELIESLSLALTGHMIGHDKSDGNKYSDGFVAGFRSCVEAAKRVDAAIAASKADGNAEVKP